MQNLPVQGFIETYVKKIVKNPNQVCIKTNEGKRSDYILNIEVANEDVGKVIGKDGKMISSLKNVISACKAKDNISYELVVTPSNPDKSNKF